MEHVLSKGAKTSRVSWKPKRCPEVKHHDGPVADFVQQAEPLGDARNGEIGGEMGLLKRANLPKNGD